MKRILTLGLLTPTAALAHPWGHEGLSDTSLLQHLTSQPDHAAMIVAVVAACLWLIYRSKARK